MLITSMDFVAGDPGKRHLGRHGALDHAARQLLLGGEFHRVGYLRGRAPPRIACPFLRQIQFAIHQNSPMAARIGKKDADLAISMWPAVSVYWRYTPAECRPFFRRPASH